MNILTIIPARGGSKGIKNKNIVEVNGKPLIEYSIKPSLKLRSLGLVSKVIVSTDSEIIARISMRLKAEVPFLRPRSLSGDRSRTVDSVLHAVRYFKERDEYFDAVLILQPTTPLRSLNDLKDAIEMFTREKSSSLISCYREESVNGLMTYRREKNKAIAYDPRHNKGIRRQESEDLYVRNGAIYLTKVSYLMRCRRIISSVPLLFQMPKERSVNIDTMGDLKLLRSILCK